MSEEKKVFEITSEEADNLGATPVETSEEHSFVVNDETKMDNLADLVEYIQTIPEEEFTKFVREKKRTMTNWLKEKHGDEAFSSETFEGKSKKEVHEHLKEKLKELNLLKQEAKKLTREMSEEKEKSEAEKE
ncbi:hypothetical protein HN587_07550 [Candidatus Woesearchaeota archaeon]|jgi:hypothetical protein|nr:hypothetical protein [Candidatus Woesearchaeota archaeon]